MARNKMRIWKKPRRGSLFELGSSFHKEEIDTLLEKLFPTKIDLGRILKKEDPNSSEAIKGTPRLQEKTSE